MIRNGDIVEAYQVCNIRFYVHFLAPSGLLPQWDSASSSWTKIGEVVDAVGSSHKQLYEGKEYDYVFDVDITDGVPPLKLPYNVNGESIAQQQKIAP